MLLSGEICPVFEMVLVSALVVHPGKRVAFFFSFFGTGASVALIVFHTDLKLRRGELGQVVSEPLPQDAGFDAVPQYHMTMRTDGFYMSEKSFQAYRSFLTHKGGNIRDG